jgi:hypothetical protein
MNAERDGATAAIIFNNSTSPDQQTMVIYKKWYVGKDIDTNYYINRV